MPFDDIRGHGRQVRILQSMLAQRPPAPCLPVYRHRRHRQAHGCNGAGEGAQLPDPAAMISAGSACSAARSRSRPTRTCMVVEPEKNVLKIEQVRALQQDIVFKPLEGKKKAVIIDQAEKMNAQAANCLLKTLEEPPEDTVLVLHRPGRFGYAPDGAVALPAAAFFASCRRRYQRACLPGRGSMRSRRSCCCRLRREACSGRSCLRAAILFRAEKKSPARLGEGAPAALKLADDLAKDDEQLGLWPLNFSNPGTGICWCCWRARWMRGSIMPILPTAWPGPLQGQRGQRVVEKTKKAAAPADRRRI